MHRNGMKNEDLQEIFLGVKEASRSLLSLSDQTMRLVLNELADEAIRQTELLLAENNKDLARMEPTNPKYDRLKLTAERIAGIADGIRQVASLPSPLYKVLRGYTLPNGLKIERISVPFGVIGIIYEARPNVSFDVAALCLKSGNACILKGGSDADCSNRAIVRIIHEVLEHHQLPTEVVTLLPATHEAAAALLHAEGFVDLIIPRGSSNLIRFVREHATIPVIETGAGICHTYFDEFGDLSKGRDIVCNAKTRRVSVCNALDCLLFHAARLADLPQLCAPLAEKRVTIYADAPAFVALQGSYPDALLQPATPEHYGTEFLDYKMAIRTVSSLEEALQQIRRYSSHHSECIITDRKAHADRFVREVDAACVYVNVPTSFTDGNEFGLGAEIGISTQKLHARGPMALEEITTYKWIIEGDGQIRK